MYPLSLNLYLTSLLTAVLIAIAISTPIDNLNYPPTANTTTSLALTQNTTLSSAAPLNTTQWVIRYGNKTFDPTTGACQGDCHTWKVAERGLDGPGDAPDTNCVFTPPLISGPIQGLCRSHRVVALPLGFGISSVALSGW